MAIGTAIEITDKMTGPLNRITAALYSTTDALHDTDQAKTTAKVKNSRNTSTAPSNGLPTTYTVKKGDCLSVIAKKFYGSGSKTYYMKIANANGISNPNLIYPNQVFTIPV